MKLTNEQLNIIAKKVYDEVNKESLTDLEKDKEYQKVKKDLDSFMHESRVKQFEYDEKISKIQKQLEDLHIKVAEKLCCQNKWEGKNLLKSSKGLYDENYLRVFNALRGYKPLSISDIKTEILLSENQELSDLVKNLIKKLSK